MVEALAGKRRFGVCKPQIRIWSDTAKINGAVKTVICLDTTMFALLTKLNEVSHGVIFEYFPYASLFAIDRYIPVFYAPYRRSSSSSTTTLSRVGARSALPRAFLATSPTTGAQTIYFIILDWIDIITHVISYQLPFCHSIDPTMPSLSR